MILIFHSDDSDIRKTDALESLEDWCQEFNHFCLTFFLYLKYIFIFILLFIGILTLLKLRGIYFKIKASGKDNEEDPLKKTRLTLGLIYIFIALGILFNFLTYFLIWCLDPLPDRFIFRFLDLLGEFKGLDPYYMNRIEEIDSSKYPHEKAIYYCIALGSFGAIVHLTLSLWYFIENTRPIINPRATIYHLFASITEGIFFGFTTCLPFFL